MGLFDIIRNLFKEQEEAAPPKFNSNMGKLKCKHCGGTIPENADYCPYCGFYIKNITGWTCPHCGASNPANTTTCRYCGVGWKCSNCGALNSSNVNICPYCGKKKIKLGFVPVETPEFLKQGGRLSQREINEQKEIEKIRIKEAEKERKIEEQRLKRLEKIEARETTKLNAKSSSNAPIPLSTSGHISSSKLPPTPPDSLDHLRTLLRRGNQQIPPPPSGGGPPSGAKIKCKGCGEWFDESLPDCPHCGAPNDRLNPQIPPPPIPPPPSGYIHCTQIDPNTGTICGNWYHKSSPTCPKCGGPNPGYVKPTSLRDSTGKNVKGKLYEFFILEIAGILSLVIPPFFGFPQQTFLAIALMGAIPAYMAMPSEHHYLESLGSGGQAKLDLPLGSLMAKASFKILAFSLIIYQFFVGFAIFRILCVIVSLIFYFSLHTRYKTSQPYRMIEAWFRMGLGAFIAIILSMTFGGFGPGELGGAFAFVGLAFFFTLPIHEEDEEEGVIKLKVPKEAKNAFKAIMTVAFIIFMLLSLWSFSTVIGGLSGTNDIFYVFWLFAFFIGIATGPEGRPTMGIIMIFLMMFILTSSYPGYVGSAVFGYWWPQISSFAETYMGPLNNALVQAQNGLGDVWLMMTNPQQFYLNAAIKNQATKSVITPGGKPISIEVEKFDLTPSIPGTLEPSEPVVGIMELHNQGDFISGSMNLSIWSSWVNATTSQETFVGSVADLQCSNATPTNGNPATCNWNGITYPTEMRSVTFVLKDGSAWDSGVINLYSDCSDNSVDPPTPCTCFSDCSYQNTTYKYSGTTVKVSTNLTYDYVVNVSLPINIINSAVYLNKLEAGDIVLQDLTSEYTGGPIKATLYSPKQPARTDIPFLVQASIYNDGQGELLSIKDFEITVYGVGDSIDWVQLIGDDFRNSSPSVNPKPYGCGDYPNPVNPSPISPPDGKYVLTCNYGYKGSVVKPGEYRRVSLYIKPKEGNIIDQKTTLIVGTATYTYRKTNTQTLTVANAPPQ